MAAPRACSLALLFHLLLFQPSLSAAVVSSSSGLAASAAARERGLEEAGLRELASEQKNPVQRVVSLLKQIKAQLEVEAETEAKMYDQMGCWCQTNEEEKTKAIASAEMKTSDLQAEIGGRAARHGKLSTDIVALKGQIQDDEQALQTATAIREKEAAEFNAQYKDEIQAVTNLKNAIEVLSKHQGGSSSLLQLDSPVFASLRTVLRDVSLKYDLLLGDKPLTRARPAARTTETALLAVDSFQPEGLNRELLRALGMNQGDQDVLPLNLAEHSLRQSARGARSAGAFVQAQGKQPIYKSYTTQSGTIFGILKQMKEEFESSMGQAQQEETKAREDYEALAQSKSAQIAAGKEKLDNLENAQAGNQKALSDSKEDFELTRNQRTADVEFLSNLRLTCQGLDKEWETRSATRTEEIKAVAEALAIITEDDARELTAKTVSLLQVDSEAEVRARRSRAAASLRRAARDPELETDDLLAAWRGRSNAGSTSSVGGARSQLATLAVSVELDAFTQVKAAMDKMMADLKAQQKEERESKEHCTNEFDSNDKMTYKKAGEKADLGEKIDALAATIENLEAEITSAKSQISSTQTAIKKASEAREKENKEFQTVVADQRATQAILKKALIRLDTFYKVAGKPALLQRAARAVQTPPVQFNKYKKNVGTPTVMSLLEQIIGDSKQLESEAVTGETQAQADYESFVKNSNAVIADLQEAVSMKTKAVASAKMDSSEANSDRQSVISELEALGEYKADLHQQCDFLLKNFEIRQRARLQEMEAIQQAKAILSGATA